MSVLELHPPLTGMNALPCPDVDGGYLCNIPMIIAIAKDGGTPKSKAFYHDYVLEYQRRAGDALGHAEREKLAFFAVAEKHGWVFASA